MSEFKQRLTEQVKEAMRARESDRLTLLRTLQAAIKQLEIDSRQTLDDAAVLTILEKQRKQRQESLAAYQKAGRDDLAAREQAELTIISEFMPQALTETELAGLIDQAMQDSGATSARDMGKVMALLKPQIAGRADSAQVAALIKQRLSA